MKILIVNAFDNNGGAARAALRLHEALLLENIDSQMLVVTKQSDKKNILTSQIKTSKWFKLIRYLQSNFLNPVRRYPEKTKTLFSSSFLVGSNIVEAINKINPDIVHLHWVCNEMLAIEDISKIQAPIVWSLHDMWGFTGGCHYDEECGRFVGRCGQCKVLKSTIENDLSRDVFLRKQKTYSKISNMTIVGLSNWLSGCAKESSLFNRRKVVTIPNPIDTNVFKPIDKKVSREIFSLPKDKELILFGAMSATSDPRKGFLLLQEAVNQLQLENIELVIFGSGERENVPSFKFKTHYLGQFYDGASLQVLYNACDVMVVPSVQENLSNTIMESLSCGLPVVAFSIGGNADLIDHKINGYLAEPADTEDLASGLDWVLYAGSYERLCINAREKTLTDFASDVVSRKYIELYSEVLSE